ncbi:phage portal protein [Roseovarius sp.]
MFGLGKKKQPEGRATSNITAVQSSPDAIRIFRPDFWDAAIKSVAVTPETALGVPALWAAVNFISGTIAGLPLQVYRKTSAGRQRVSGGLAPILHDAVNEEMTSFNWRKYTFERVLTTGRAFTFIERNAQGRIMNLWPLEPDKVEVKRQDGRLIYVYGKNTYEAREIIDLAFMMKPDGIGHKGPIMSNKEVIGRAIAATQYGSKYLTNGGVPPFAVTGNFQSGDALRRAGDDLANAVKKAAEENRLALTLPMGLDIKPIGGDPEKNQLVETQRFDVEQIARIYSIPPTFLQDLTHGTFSNTEQQDLHFVKHTLKRWIEQAEQEMNLKLFGRGARQYVEFNVDGLLRGDFKTRMEGHATAIQNGIETPNEAREIENRPALEGGDSLMIQGATVPITQQQQPNGGDDGL